jgi:hypothetical protein
VSAAKQVHEPKTTLLSILFFLMVGWGSLRGQGYLGPHVEHQILDYIPLRDKQQEPYQSSR